MKRLRIGLVTRREMKGYLFMLPWMIGCAFFLLRPLITSVYYCMHKLKLTATMIEFRYVGVENFGWIFQAYGGFILDTITHFTQAILEMAVILVLALIIAMMLNKPIRCKGIFRMLFFLPIIAVSGPILERLMGSGGMSVPVIESYSMVRVITSVLPESIAVPLTTLFSELMKVLWFSGVPILLYMTGLQKIDRARYEAALIDGADGWVSFWKITLPSMRPFILINGIYTLVFLSTNATCKPLNTIMSQLGATSYGEMSAASWIFTAAEAVILGLYYFIVRERKSQEVEIVKTRDQVRLERLHTQRAQRLKEAKGK